MDNTEQAILKRMRERLVSQASKMDGSFASDNLGAVAYELGRLYGESYNRLLERAHTSSASGEDLDVAAYEDHRMTRKAETKEVVTLTVTGVPGTLLDTSMGAKAGDFVFLFAEESTIGADGTAKVKAEAAFAGSGYSVSAGEVNQLITSYGGVESVINEEASSGGYDRETDEEFRARIAEFESEIKGYGNNAWYRATAREVSGVARAKVLECARGLGTVDVIIVADGNTEASESLIERTKAHIEETRLSGVDLEVFSGAPREIQVAATLYIQTGYRKEAVEEQFRLGLSEYLSRVDFGDREQTRVSYSKINNILSACSGVTDIDGMTLNGSVESVVLEKREFPIVGDITLEVM